MSTYACATCTQFVGCLVAVHGRFVCAFVGAVTYVERAEAWPMLFLRVTHVHSVRKCAHVQS